VATINRLIDLFAPGEMTRITEGRVPPEDRERGRALLSRLHDGFLERSRREARAGARIIAWPEGNLLVLASDEDAFLSRAKQLAADERIYLVMGMGTITIGSPRPFENKSVVIDPSGSVAISYRKSHPVPGWEAGIMQRGDGRVPVVSTDLGRLSTLICFDADFPEFVRQVAAGRADLLVVPANDWPEIKALHFQMHVFRAIETGMPLLRAGSAGISGAVDPWGRVLGTADYFAAGDRTFTAQLPVGSVRTLYARIGDAFAWLCMIATAAALVLPFTE
jgi:apolipoprotein N-acyltransferase